MLAWLRLEQELAEARALDAELAAEEARLAQHIALMRPDHLDPDMLEEQARLLLNYGRSDDYLVLLPEKSD